MNKDRNGNSPTRRCCTHENLARYDDYFSKRDPSEWIHLEKFFKYLLSLKTKRYDPRIAAALYLQSMRIIAESPGVSAPVAEIASELKQARISVLRRTFLEVRRDQWMNDLRTELDELTAIEGALRTIQSRRRAIRRILNGH
jgi:hypothetical protein